MKKTNTVLLAIVLLLALAALAWLCVANFVLPAMSAGYNDARDAFLAKDEFTLTAKNTMNVTADGLTTVTEYTAKITKADGMYFIVENDGTSDVTYYFKDGKTYVAGEQGKFFWEDTEEGFMAMFCYAEPLDVTLERKDVGSYAGKPDGAEHIETLLALNPSFASIDPAAVSVDSFEYTASVSGEHLVGYTYDYAFTTNDADAGEVKATNVLSVSVGKEAGDIVFPEDTSDYEESAKDLADAGLSQEAFNEQMLYVIFETLYNPDGSKVEDYDNYYQQFVEDFGEETMEKLAQVAELISAQLALEDATE